MFKQIATVLIALTFASGMVYWTPQEQDQEFDQEISPFMQRKLDDSRNIISGLALEDYELISKSAQDLMVLSQEADWKVLTTPEYLKMSSEFRDAAQRLRDNATDKNVDGATLAYFEVTLSCVRCHKYVRANNN